MKYTLANPDNTFNQIDCLYAEYGEECRYENYYLKKWDGTDKDMLNNYYRHEAKRRGVESGIIAVARILGIEWQDVMNMGRIARKYMESTNYEKCFHEGIRLLEYYANTAERHLVLTDWLCMEYIPVKNRTEPTERQNEIAWRIEAMKKRREKRTA